MSKIWTPEKTEELTNLYAEVNQDNSQLANIAAKMQLTVASVRSKLVNMQVYKKPEEPKKVGGASSVRKVNLVRDLAKKLDMEFDTIESLEKATKPALESLLEVLNKD